MSGIGPTLSTLVSQTASYGNPIDCLRKFIDNEERIETARQVDKMRFAGYVLELGYDDAKIITSDPYKLAVGGIPRGSFLIMTPSTNIQTLPHFTLLRITGVSATPLSSQVQQTYFELHKKSMPELNVWTQSELRWGALDCTVLGMFYADPSNMQRLAFSGDVNNVVSAHRYKVYAPDKDLLDVIVNGIVPIDLRIEIGALRTMECELTSEASLCRVSVIISVKNFKGCRTAMFGKTRLGKLNVVKLIAQGMIDATRNDQSVGQLIFDINGEYANDNPQDGNTSIRSLNDEECSVYALKRRPATPSKPLRLNFYAQPASCLEIIGNLLEQDNEKSHYITSFVSVKLSTIEGIRGLDKGDQTRAVRKIQIFFWAILGKAGFDADEAQLRATRLKGGHAQDLDPHFNAKVRAAVFGANTPAQPRSIADLVREIKSLVVFWRANPNHADLSGVFDADDEALLNFFSPKSGSGPRLLMHYRDYHHPKAGDLVTEILKHLNMGQTVILDLGQTTDKIRRYFADLLSREVFLQQEAKFADNKLGNHYVELYFEEAHNLFPRDDKNMTGVYARFAKEGAKFHIGMVYSTQSPSTINQELLAQTENFFVGHLSSQDEAKALSRVQVAYVGSEPDILRAKTPGYMRMLSMSHRFVVPVQAHRFGLSTPKTY